MLKKTAVTGGLLITAGGILLTTYSPAFAAPTHLVANHNRNWNGSENENFNHIRLRIHNRNNNIAVARVQRPDRERRDIIMREPRQDDRGNAGAFAPAP